MNAFQPMQGPRLGAGVTPKLAPRAAERNTLVAQTMALMPPAYLMVAIYLLVLGAQAKPLPVDSPELACAVGAVFCICTAGLTLLAGRFSLFSLPGAFLGISGLYLVGILIAFPYLGEEAFATWFLVDMESILRGVPFVMLAFACFYLGVVLGLFRSRGESIQEESADAPGLAVYVRAVGGLLFAGSMGVVLFATLSGGGLRYALDGGYHYLSEMQYLEGGSTLLWASLNWFLPWGVLILAGTARVRRDLVWLSFAVIPTNIVLIIVGDRGGLFVLDIVLLMRLSLTGFRLRWWHTVLAAAAIVLAIPALMVLRQSAARSWTLTGMRDALMFNAGDAITLGTDPISATLIEGGLSYKVLMGTVALVPDSHGFHYGADYPAAMIGAVPFFSKYFPELAPNNSLWVKDYVEHPLSTAGLGFLQLAESYIQFGVYGVAALYLLIGYGLVRTWRYFSSRRAGCNQLAYFLVMVNALLLWIRNDFNIMVKPMVWCFVLLIFVPKIINWAGRRRVEIPNEEADLPTETVGAWSQASQ